MHAGIFSFSGSACEHSGSHLLRDSSGAGLVGYPRRNTVRIGIWLSFFQGWKKNITRLITPEFFLSRHSEAKPDDETIQDLSREAEKTPEKHGRGATPPIPAKTPAAAAGGSRLKEIYHLP